MGGSRDVMLQDVGEARGLVTSVAELIACGCLKEMRMRPARSDVSVSLETS